MSHTGSSLDSVTAPPSPPSSTRWRLVDTIRGFALAGILLTNVGSLTTLGYGLEAGDWRPSVGATALDLLVESRFVPIFCFLFGLSLQLIVTSARRRGSSPWPPLLLRLGALFGMGLLHALVFPGDVLRIYAVGGLLILPLAILAPRVIVAVAGVVLLAAGFAVGGGMATVPGLLALGSASASFGLPAALERGGPRVVRVFVVSALVGAAGAALQLLLGPELSYGFVAESVGMVLSVAYVTGFALLWRTPVRRVLAAAFEALGRMALTNYVSASIVIASVVALVPGVDASERSDPTPGLLLALGLLVVQAVASRLWLTRLSYGPVEWLWRTITWRSVARLRGGAL
ncbi:DUF418 domain-containing protein [Frigoribacterium sp. CFBP 13712]|uniref:DUF418 domain-containing protein n=1 Tax=Frigoribacterium sp. CFBP 13712 TaxID=2775309 RepID=UPI001784E5E2|nr:DUF418 domain-containing protein [Frigoribacterium sp. CFBP 13712]MBD8704464.1 DUF418 domain-containing protein [Frigoribacterium sp. CFBP 13712]